MGVVRRGFNACQFQIEFEVNLDLDLGWMAYFSRMQKARFSTSSISNPSDQRSKPSPVVESKVESNPYFLKCRN